MKKNFLKIASLLIAAMLLVVSCSQEVAPKTEENGLVEATIGLGRSSRDISITDSDSKKISYQYTLTPEWSIVDNGTPIYGAVTSKKPITGAYEISDPVSDVSLGLVTPGLWKVTVYGYVDSILVLKGTTTAYFTGDSTSKTVFVAPVSNGEATGTLNISLKMQDLGSSDLNKIDYTIETLGVSGSETGTITKNPSFTGKVGTYENNNISVKSGFNKITLSIPGKEGGITSTFLMIPGRTVTISGSVYPSDFVSSPVNISVIDLKDASLTVSESTDVPKSKEDVAVEEGDSNSQKVNMYVLTKGTDYTFAFVDDTDYTSFFVAKDNVRRTYQWYVGSSEISGAKSESVTSSNLGIKDKSGDFAITCVTTYEFEKDGVTYKIEASATEGKVRVK